RAGDRAARRARAPRRRARGRTPPSPTASGRGGTSARSPRRPRRTRGSTACTGGAGASRSRASLRAAARRTPALLPLASPRHDPAAEAMPPRAYVVDSRLAPQVEQTRQRPALVVPADRRPEELACLEPAVADDAPGRRQPDSHPQLPRPAPDAARNPELEP